jgi:hypothetical protein
MKQQDANHVTPCPEKGSMSQRKKSRMAVDEVKTRSKDSEYKKFRPDGLDIGWEKPRQQEKNDGSHDKW